MIQIRRYSIPQLPRNKYKTATIAISSGGSSSGDSVVNNYVNNTEVVDNLLSTDKTAALSANQGRILDADKASRVKNEIIDGRYEFTNGFDTNGLTTEGIIQTIDYSDVDDKGAALYQNEAKTEWNGILDNLTVRGKFNVKNLEVEEARHIGGDIYLTKAGMICTKVEVINEGLASAPMVRYKCFFDNVNKDGLKIFNQFQMGDLAFCQSFNNNKSRKWWRAVHGVGENYILVDGVDCLEGSDIPKEGDHIVQLGNITRTEAAKERQTAVILWTDSICLYRDINDFVLPEPYIRLNPIDTKIDAETINFLGKTIINGNFIVDKAGNLTVKGHIVATSGEFTGTIKANTGNIGNFTIKDGGLFNDTSTTERANITITDDLNPAKATRAFVVNPKNLAPEVKGAVVTVAHRVNEGDGVEAYTTNGNAIWGITETGQALTGYATKEGGTGLSANRVKLEGLSLNLNKLFDDYYAFIPISDTNDIIVIANSVKQNKTFTLPPTSGLGGKIYIIKNNSNVTHTLQTNRGTTDLIENINGTKTTDTYIIPKNSNIILVNTGNWSIIYER